MQYQKKLIIHKKHNPEAALLQGPVCLAASHPAAQVYLQAGVLLVMTRLATWGRQLQVIEPRKVSGLGLQSPEQEADLSGVDDAGSHEVLVGICGSIVANVVVQRLQHLLLHHTAVHTRIVRNQPQWVAQRASHYLRAHLRWP